MVRDLLFNDGGRNINDETREKLQFLNNTTLNGRHSNIYNIKDVHQNDKWVSIYTECYWLIHHQVNID